MLGKKTKQKNPPGHSNADTGVGRQPEQTEKPEKDGRHSDHPPQWVTQVICSRTAL